MNSRNSPNRSFRKTVIALAVAAVVIGGGYYVYAQFFRGNDEPPSSINYGEPTKDQIQTGKEAKEETIKQDEVTSGENTSSDPKNPSDKKETSLRADITAASVEDGTLYVRNTINGIYQTGTCTLKLTKGNSVVQKTSSIQPLPKESTCRGFNVNTSELSNGTWVIELIVTINGEVSTARASVAI